MKALYSRKELQEISSKECSIALQKYIDIFSLEREKIKKLKHYEKDFFFQNLYCLFNSENKKVFNIFRIPEANEFVFYKIILTHADGIMVFDGKLRSASDQFLTPNEKRRNKRFFYEYLEKWKNQVNEGRGSYFTIIKPSIQRKIKECKKYCIEKNITSKSVNRKIDFIYALFFNIYYNAKMFFDDCQQVYIQEEINKIDIVFNVYSYVHIFCRHYFPDMNFDENVSLTPDLDFIDIKEMPISILNLVSDYNKKYPITKDTRYCLFTSKGEQYILWLKKKNLNETKKEGLEVRSFYKCIRDSDFMKFNKEGSKVLEIRSENHL